MKLLKQFFTKSLGTAILSFPLAAAYVPAAAQTMAAVGAAGFTSGTVSDVTMALDAGNTPYVAFTDSANTGKATVMKYSGSAWAVVGAAGFSSGAAITPAIAIDKNSGTPYVVFSDDAHYQNLSVMKYSSGAWVYVGTAGFTTNRGDNPSITIDNTGTPYIAFTDWNATTSLAGTVMKFNGTSWVYVGAEGFTPGQADNCIVKTDGSGVPYMLFGDGNASQKTTVMKYSGASWALVGTAGFSAGVAYEPTMAIASNGNIYVGYSDWSINYTQQATVMKYSGSSWSLVGTKGFSTGTVYTPSIVISSSGTPYISYTDAGLSNKAVLMKYNGSAWSEIGATGGFSAGAASFTSLALDASGNPYVAYKDETRSGKITVMRDMLVSGVATLQASKAGFIPYPNPNSGSFTIRSEESGTCTITNVLGQVVRSVILTGNNNPIAVSGLKSGIYFAALNNDPATTQKIIVE